MNTTPLDIISTETRDQWLNAMVGKTRSQWDNGSGSKVKQLLLHSLERDKQVAGLKDQLEKEALINNILVHQIKNLTDCPIV